MKKKNHRWLTVALTLIGVALIVSSVSTVVISSYKIKTAQKNTELILSDIKELMPRITAGIIDDRASVSMPSAEVYGNNFVGIIEIPLYERELPLYFEWDNKKAYEYPCRYTGSIYDSTLIVGGCDTEGQLDFVKNITITDSVYVTDMTGAKFAYSVTYVEKAKEIKTQELSGKEADLIIFAKNSFSFDYTVVLCKLKPFALSEN